ncbi:MAG: HAMP domain-containing sensor histidine kinase [Clostridia bacterium]|nr:HAMP domain-containing sensor histidine kinase [Clostridia bacterium]
MRKLRLPDFSSKLIGNFIKVLLLTVLLSGATTVLMNLGYIDGEMVNWQSSIAGIVRALDESAHIPPEDMQDILKNTQWQVSLADWDELTQEEGLIVKSGENVAKGPYFAKELYFCIGNALMVISTYPFNSVLITALLRSLLGNLILIGIGIALVFIISRRMAQPIVNLTEATRQIAKRNFDIIVDPHMPRFSGGIKELAELTENFNLMAHELKGIEYLRRDFTSNLSHELKTPVASIIGYARMLQYDQLSPEDRREYANMIWEECMRLSKLSDNLLKLTRLESSPTVGAGERFFVDEQLRRMINAMHPRIEKKKQTIQVDLFRAKVRADKELMEQVWQNLLDNAIKFTPEGGNIKVTMSKVRFGVSVRFEDDGIGMDGATMSRIFEKFYQADISHHTGGNGLGLPLVKRILDLTGATIDVASEPGKGSAFTVTLPAG